MQKVYCSLVSFLLSFAFPAFLTASSEATVLSFDQLSSLDQKPSEYWMALEGKKVRMRGFWYAEDLSGAQFGILSPKPDACSCCLQKKEAKEPSILVSGSLLPASSPLRVKCFEGIFHCSKGGELAAVHPLIFSLEEAREVTEESFFSLPWTFAFMLSPLALWAIGKLYF